jgi:iron complex outermembrane recepter protein
MHRAEERGCESKAIGIVKTAGGTTHEVGDHDFWGVYRLNLKHYNIRVLFPQFNLNVPIRTYPRRHVLSVSLLLALSLGSTIAQAADAPDTSAQSAKDPRHDEPQELDRVIVKASPLRKTAEELSQPVEVLSAEGLDRAKAATLGETVERLPGVQSSNFGPGVGRPIIRGLDGPRTAVLSGGLSSQDVSTISQDHAAAIEPFLADQIEVLKGPATLLYGSGAIGGVVNVVDGRIAERALDETITGRAEVRYDTVSKGKTGMARFDAMGANGALVLHADGLYRDFDDYDTPDGEQINSFVETRSGALGASYIGSDGFIGVSLSRFDHRYGNPGEPGDPDEGEAGVTLDMLQDRFELKAGLDRDFWIFNGMRFGFANTDYGHTEFEGDEIGTVFDSQANEGRLELTHRPFGAWTGAIGLQIGERTFEAIGDEAFVPRTKTRSQGLFLVEQAQWGAFQLDVGARIDRVRTDSAENPRRSFSPLSLSLGGLWNLNDNWRFTVNLDRAERAPAEEELYAFGPHVATGSFEIGDNDLREERADQAELGLHFHSDRFDAKASVYKTRFAGFIYLADTGEFTPEEEGEEPLPIRVWTQEDADFTGLEAEFIAKVIDNEAGKLDVRVFGDYVRGELDNGGNLPRIAPSRFGASAAWENDAWRASLGATRVMRQDDVAAGETETAGYTLVDAHFAYHWDTDAYGWEVFVDGRNLTDETARVHTSYLKDNVVLPGRNFNLGMRIFF